MLFGGKYKKIIREAGFDNLLNTEASNYNTLIREYVTNTFEDWKIPRGERKNQLKIRIEKLESLYRKVYEVTNKEILNTIQYLIDLGKNALENFEIVVTSSVSKLVYVEKLHNKILGFRVENSGGLLTRRRYYPNIDFNTKYYFKVYNGNIYLVDYDTYKLVPEWTILHDEIESIEIYKFEEDIKEDRPAYRSTYAPVNNAAIYSDPRLRKEADDKYKKDLAEYQANLIINDAYNREQERKYLESNGKTTYKLCSTSFNKKTPFSTGEYCMEIITDAGAYHGLINEKGLDDIKKIYNK